ncbi:hypothetical protein [Bacteroides sp.]|uniref:hypothetical protein n=1 Tax=Bacteroides sp. TaxID=29523 RepID=UPI002FC5ACEC
MKKINEYLSLLTCVIALLCTACEEDITREVSPETNPDASNVYFSSKNTASPVLTIDQSSFDVIVSRKKTDKEISVGLTSAGIHKNLFQVPSSVTFKAGEAEKVITVKTGDIELMKKYPLTIEVEASQTTPYAQQDVYPRIELNIVKEDFAPYADGSYVCEFFESEKNTILEYSPSTDTYRFKNCWVAGYNVTFKWDKKTTIKMIGTVSGDFTVVVTGYVHSKYGMVSAFYSKPSYDEATKKFTFPITWRVSAGSFGEAYDYYSISKIL